MTFLLVDIDAEIEPVGRRKPVIVPAGNIVHHRHSLSVRRKCESRSGGNRHPVSGGNGPYCAQVHSFTEFLVQADAEVVPAVINEREAFSIVDGAVAEDAVGLGQCI